MFAGNFFVLTSVNPQFASADGAASSPDGVGGTSLTIESVAASNEMLPVPPPSRTSAPRLHPLPAIASNATQATSTTPRRRSMVLAGVGAAVIDVDLARP